MMLLYINSERMPLLYYKAHSILHRVKMYQTQEIKKRLRVSTPVLHPSDQPWADQHAYQEIYPHLSLCYHAAKI